MFAILLSILFSTNVLAAPVQSNGTAPWSYLRHDKTLTRFQSTLLNETLLTFLNECYLPQLSSIRVRAPCTRYFDAVLQLNNTDYVVSQPTVEKLFKEFSRDKNFCNQKHIFPVAKYYPDVESLNYANDSQACGYICMQAIGDAELVPRPICTFLVWMGEQIKNPKSAPPPPAAAIPLEPKSVSSTIATNKTISALPTNKGVSQELQKPEVPNAVAEKSELPNPNKASNTQNNISAQLSPNDKQPQIAIPAKNESIDRKENPAPVPVPVAPAAILPSSKEEKKQLPPAKEEQEESPVLAASPILPVEESPPKDVLTNPDKHDSLSVEQQPNEDQPNENDSDVDPNDEVNQDDNDDEADDFEMSQQKLKPKNPPLARPDEIEGDQKSSQEIIERNYLPNVNHVTDPFLEESGSNFFTYFLIGMFLCITLYVVYHNKSKILALLLEGRRNEKGRSGRRKHTAAYRKLDSNLEEAITSSASGRTTQIIY